MQRKTQRRLAWLVVPLCLSMLAAACGDDDDDAESGDSGGGGGGSNSVNVSGSSTVEPISSLVAEEFQLENEGVEVAVDGPGTGDGFELFCNGETDISDASRPIDEEETAACEENGIEFVELQIGFDGLTVMTNPANEAVECLSLADLYALIGPEATGTNWSDGATIAGELGSNTQFPDAPLELTGPGQESGTYDSFLELAITPIAEERGLPEDQAETIRSDYSASADDNVIVENITASDSSLGWVGFAFAEGAGDTIKEIAVAAEPNGDCVEPSPETISDESYPLSRPLFIYVNAASATDNQAVADYVDFYLADLNTWVEDAGYVGMPDNLVQETTSAWESR